MPRGVPRPKVRITKRWLETVTASDPRGERHYDSEVRGFGVTVYPSGRRVFFVEYMTGRRRRRLALGPFGELTVGEARTKALQVQAKAREGVDPLAEREAQDAAPTFRAWVESYLAEIRQRKRPSGIKADECYLARACERLGRKKLAEITVADVQRFRDWQQEKGVTTANRALASIRSCLSAAWRANQIAENPALRVKPLPEKPPRARVLSDDEMARLLKAVEALEDPFARAALLMIIHTGCRLREALGATWDDLHLEDLDAATWRLPRPKSGRPEVKPITRYMAEVLSALPRKSRYVIAGRSPLKPRADLKGPWRRVCEAAELEGVTIHDLRRTYGLAVTRVAGLHVASKALGHSTVKVTEAVYAPLQERELREAAERVAAERRAKAKVIPIKKADGDDT